MVDNFWEWKRPNKYPCRRISVFANQQLELAKKSGPENGTTYRVEFNGRFKLCVVVGNQDSKHRPDCKRLKKLLFSSDFFGKSWLNDVNEKKEIGRLQIPCMTKSEIDDLFETNTRLKEIRQKVYDPITYWDCVKLISNDMVSPDP